MENRPQKPQRKEITEQEKALLNKLLPRMFKLKLIHIPQSKESEVIVEPNRSVLGFKTNCYRANEKYLSRYIHQQQFDRVVFRANKIIEEEVLENKRREHTDSFAEATLFLKVSVAMTLIGILLMAVIVYGKFQTELESVLQYVAIGLICVAVASAIAVVVFIHRTKFIPSSFEEKVWEKLTELMSGESKALSQAGRPFLTWGVGQQFFWLSLSISYLHMPKDYVPLGSSLAIAEVP